MDEKVLTASDDQPTVPCLFRVHKIGLFIMMGILHLLNWFHRVSPSVISIYIADDFGISIASLSSLSSIFFYPNAIMQPFAGMLADVFDPGYVIGFGCCGCVVGNLICGFAKSLTTAKMGRLVLGLSAGPIYVAAVRCLSGWFDEREFQTIVAGMIAISGFGVLIGQAPLPMFADAFGWRWVFFGVAMITGVVTILVFLFARGHPGAFGWPDRGGVPEKSRFIVRFLHELRSIRRIWKSVDFWWLAMFCFLLGGARQNFIGMWGATWYAQVVGLSVGRAAQVSIASALGVIVGTPGIGRISDLSQSRKWPGVGCACLGLLITIIFTWVHLPSNFWVCCVLQFLFIIGCGNPLTIADVWGKEKYPPEEAMDGACLGVTNFWCYAGSAVWQEISGVILAREPRRDDGTYSPESFRNALWYPGLACVAVALLCGCLSRESELYKPRVREPQVPEVEAAPEDKAELELGEL